MKTMFRVKVAATVAAATVAVAVAVPSPARAAVQVWASDLISDAQAGKPSGGQGPVSIVGAKGGVFSGKVVVESSAPIKGLRASAGELSMNGAVIPARNLRLRYAVAWGREWRQYPPIRGLDILLESPPAEVPAHKGRALAPVWVTVEVPWDAKPGLYRGSLKVEAEGLSSQTVPVELKVADWTLPDPEDFRTWVGMIQSPDTLSVEYKVPLWSEKHWELIARSFRYMRGVGCRNVYIPLLCQTNFGNAESVVRWIKKGDDKYDHDFSVMEKYLDLAEEHLGKPKMVVFQAWDVYLHIGRRGRPRPIKPEEVRTEAKPLRDTVFGLDYKASGARRQKAREAVRGTGTRVTVVDPKTGKTEPVYLLRYEDPVSRALWQPVWTELRKRMKGRGLEKTMMLGMLTDFWPNKAEVQFLHEVSGGLQWAAQAHPGRLLGKAAVGNKLLHKIADLGYEAHVYNLGYQVNPDKGRPYGWRHPELVVRFPRGGASNSASCLQMRLRPEFNITGHQRGVGRVGADVWNVIKDKRGRRAGAVYHRYPESTWRNLDIGSWVLAPGPEGALGTARLENLREGVQECEARILLERALLDSQKKEGMGAELAGRCQELLDERQRALWKSIWTSDEDLASQGTVRARNPIEALYLSLKKGGKDLPGYWDSRARQMRRDGASKGRQWFAASGWQERNHKLFTLAGDVARKLGITTTRRGVPQRRPQASRPDASKRISKPPARSPPAPRRRATCPRCAGS